MSVSDFEYAKLSPREQSANLDDPITDKKYLKRQARRSEKKMKAAEAAAADAFLVKNGFTGDFEFHGKHRTSPFELIREAFHGKKVTTEVDVSVKGSDWTFVEKKALEPKSPLYTHHFKTPAEALLSGNRLVYSQLPTMENVKSTPALPAALTSKPK